MQNFLTLLPAALAMMATPGPVTLASAALGATWPRPIAARAILGMTAGTATIIVLVATGVTGVVTVVPGAELALSVMAAVYIVYLAWKIATAPPFGDAQQGATAPMISASYLFAVANPKAFAAMGALFADFPLIEDAAALNAVVKSLTLAALALCINFSWMLAGAALVTSLRDPGASRTFNILMALLLLLSVGAAWFL